MAYQEITFTGVSPFNNDVLIALLADIGAEGFQEDAAYLKAFIDDRFFDRQALDKICEQFGVQYRIETIADTNWNQLWESNFEPVSVDNFCCIRAHFHPAARDVAHDIVITPKMSFGTGHHATTYMMIMQMSVINFSAKKVLDFGSGTGVLAILAHKLGAAKVVAIDNDEWSIANAAENFERNHADGIELIRDDRISGAGTFDIILANINRNVIVAQLLPFTERLSENGLLLLSGLLKTDRDYMIDQTQRYNFNLKKELDRGEWISLLLTLS